MAKKIYKNKTVLILLAITAVAVISIAIYIKMAQKPKASQPAAVQQTAQTKTNAGPEGDTTSKPATPQSSPGHPISSLAKPIGPNNNTSTISLSGGATGMESTCRSVAGASCYIQATKGSQVITVSVSKTIGSDSASDGVVLDWDANKLSTGTWSIQAVATKDGQTAISDAQNLKVNS